MFNWKKKIDDEEEALKEEEDRKEKEFREGIRKELETKIQEIGRKFKCHVCDKPAQKPVPIQSHHYGIWDGAEDWSEPGDLWKCVRCKNWTCAEHIHKGVCKKCAEKM